MSDQRKNVAGDQELVKSGLSTVISEASGNLVKEAMDSMMRGRLESGSSQLQHSTERAQDGSGSNRATDRSKESRQEDNKASDKISDTLRKIRYDFVFRPKEDGVTELATKDKLVKDGDREILFMPNGDKLTVSKDGSFDLKAKGPVEVHKKGDTTTVTYPNGDSVSFGKNGVESVTRGGVTSEILEPKMRNELKPFPYPEPNPFPHPHVDPRWDGGPQWKRPE
jgi:hypothetical protein